MSSHAPVPKVRFAAVRALILSEISGYTDEDEQDEDACTDELMMRAIVRDLAAMKV
jgi:hypothetical protein